MKPKSKSHLLLLFSLLPVLAHAQASSVQVEHVFSGAGSFNFNHALNDEYPLYSCFSLSGASAYTATPIDANNMQIAVSAAATILCAFQATAGLSPDFQFTVTPSTYTYTPTMTGTQTPTFAIAQTAIGGYSGTVTYSTTGLASGMSSGFSPSTITGTGSSTMSISFPATQASGLTTITASGTDGTLTHTNPLALTISDINSGLLDGWQMNEGSGTTFNDATSNANNQTFSAGIGAWGTVAGFPGSAFTFNGTGSSTGSNNTLTNFDGTTPFSVCAWINPTSVATPQVIASNLSGASGTGWQFGISNASTPTTPAIYLRNSSSNQILVYGGATGVIAGALSFVCFTYDGSKSASGVNTYVNGAQETLTINSNTLTVSIANSQNVVLGGEANGATLFTGTMGYVRIYNRVLSSTDITAMYAAGPR